MLKQRIITAIVLALLFIAVTVLLDSFQYSLFVSAVVLLASWEWCGLIGLTQKNSKLGYVATLATMILALYFFLGIGPAVEFINASRVSIILGLGVLFWALALLMLKGYPANANHWNDKSKIALMGLMTLIPTWAGVVQLKFIEPQGLLVLAMVILVAAADIGAYFVGKGVGKNKLAPALSPNKTWEGVWGGLVASFLAGLLLIWFIHNYLGELTSLQVVVLMALSLAVAFLDVVGDLLESMLKRNRDIKDSGTILPGHGGILDRVDGLLAVTPVFVLTFLIIE